MQAAITWLQGKKTNILAWAALVLGALVLSGALTPEQQGEANERLAALIERLTALLVEIGGLVALAMRAGVAKSEAAAKETAQLLSEMLPPSTLKM